MASDCEACELTLKTRCVHTQADKASRTGEAKGLPHVAGTAKELRDEEFPDLNLIQTNTKLKEIPKTEEEVN